MARIRSLIQDGSWHSEEAARIPFPREGEFQSPLLPADPDLGVGLDRAERARHPSCTDDELADTEARHRPGGGLRRETFVDVSVAVQHDLRAVGDQEIPERRDGGRAAVLRTRGEQGMVPISERARMLVVARSCWSQAYSGLPMLHPPTKVQSLSSETTCQPPMSNEYHRPPFVWTVEPK